MMRINILLLAFHLFTVTGSPSRIIDGSITTIDKYPEIASLQVQGQLWNQHACGGIILNERSILSAAHCFISHDFGFRWSVRVGSSYANSFGFIYTGSGITRHPDFDTRTLDSDIAILGVSRNIVFSDVIKPGNIARMNYNVPDGEAVWAVGWGDMGSGLSEDLRHVKVRTINQEVCSNTYSNLTDNMLCTGWIEGSAGRGGPCDGDFGGPLYHNGVVVGVMSLSQSCDSEIPAVNVRVSRFSNWIVNNQ